MMWGRLIPWIKSIIKEIITNFDIVSIEASKDVIDKKKGINPRKTIFEAKFFLSLSHIFKGVNSFFQTN